MISWHEQVDELSASMQEFNAELLNFAQRETAAASKGPSYAPEEVLYRLRFTLRRGEILLDRAKALANNAPGPARAEMMRGVAIFTALLEPFRDALLKAQDAAAVRGKRRTP